jgi:hypothetical protein
MQIAANEVLLVIDVQRDFCPGRLPNAFDLRYSRSTE